MQKNKLDHRRARTCDLLIAFLILFFGVEGIAPPL